MAAPEASLLPDAPDTPGGGTPPAQPMKLDRADGSATLELYRAALGPLRRDYYLRAFTRFDAVGKTGPSFNPVAGLLTLNWLAFRGLWAVLLVYVGAQVFAALVILGIGRVLFQLSDPAQWALAGLVLLASVLVPGLWGNAWLYAALSKKMERALVDTATLEEACAVLSAQAAGQRRAGILLAVNVALAAAVAALVSAWPDAESLPLQTSTMEQARSTTEIATSGLAQQSIAAAANVPATTASGAPATGTPSPQVAAPLNAEEAQAHAARMSKGVVQMASPQAQVASATPAATQKQTQAPTAPAPTPATNSPVTDQAVATPVIAAAPAKPASQASAARAAASSPAAPANHASQEAHTSSEKPKKTQAPEKKPRHEVPALAAHEKKKEKAPPPPPAASKKAGAETEHYLINVGLFADANNARNAITKLKDAGLPVLSSTLQSAKGDRTRVRVGPFETQVEADRVAEKIRALQLDAVVVKP